MVSESHKVTLDVCVKKDLQEGTGQRKIQLEADGLISREEYVEVPIRIEYKITEKAKNLIPILKDLAKWGLTLCDDHDS